MANQFINLAHNLINLTQCITNMKLYPVREKLFLSLRITVHYQRFSRMNTESLFATPDKTLPRRKWMRVYVGAASIRLYYAGRIIN